ncbi:MAG: hypothetical protein JO317_08870, partial [Verrucomicrobiae bacterium]|nr:hypothetical protein [Verrucomicrobiae bacterium]
MMLVLTGCASWPGDSASIARPDPNSPRAFSFQRDTFAFANETVWQYKDGKPVQSVPDKTDPEGEGYIHHCFVMSRAALQFWKFARFEPNAPKLSRAELAERVRLIARRAAWRDALPPAERVVLPGYRDLRQFSATEGGLLRENLGASWP